jgi:hypothetical protein
MYISYNYIRARTHAHTQTHTHMSIRLAEHSFFKDVVSHLLAKLTSQIISCCVILELYVISTINFTSAINYDALYSNCPPVGLCQLRIQESTHFWLIMSVPKLTIIQDTTLLTIAPYTCRFYNTNICNPLHLSEPLHMEYISKLCLYCDLQAI